MWGILLDEFDALYDERFNNGGELDEKYRDEVFGLLYEDALSQLAPDVYEQALATFIAAHPGRRPSWWWEKHAPEERRSEAGLMESQARYLGRLNLLSTAEIRRLKQTAYEPVPEPVIVHDHAPMPCNCGQRIRSLL